MEWKVNVWDWSFESDFTWFTGSEQDCKQFITDNRLTVVDVNVKDRLFSCE